MPEAHVNPVVERDGSDSFGAMGGGVHETNQHRDLNLQIEPEGDRFRLTVDTNDPGLAEAFGDDREHLLPMTKDELWGHVQACRQVWRRHVVDFLTGNEHPFQERWDFRAEPQFLAAVLPEIAVAGSKLFLELFYPRPPANPEEYEGLRNIGQALRKLMSQQTRWLRVISDSFFVPWCLIYSDELKINGSNARPEGFWGYQHLIEHSPPAAGSLANELKLDQGRLEMGLQLDQAIDRDLAVRCLAPVLEHLDRYPAGALVRHVRPTRDEFARALRDGPVSEQVLFFCCHAEQEGDSTAFRTDEGYLVLSDRSTDPRDTRARITPADLDFWMDMKEFGHGPLVFLNACGSGQLNSVFYASFGKKFLGLRASSVIGAQTELPAVFAGEFARRFFDAFLKGGLDNKIGKVLFRLRREFIDQHKNPLGLIYSLYRGADCCLERGLLTK